MKENSPERTFEEEPLALSTQETKVIPISESDCVLIEQHDSETEELMSKIADGKPPSLLIPTNTRNGTQLYKNLKSSFQETQEYDWATKEDTLEEKPEDLSE